MAADRAKDLALLPRSTMRPAYITITRSAISATTPMSWVMNTMAEPWLRLQLADEIEDLRLHRDVERGRRLVGDQQRGIAGQRHGDHRALAHAARQLVRIAVDGFVGLGDVDLGQQLDGAWPAPRALPIFSCARICSAICQPIV